MIKTTVSGRDIRVVYVMDHRKRALQVDGNQITDSDHSVWLPFLSILPMLANTTTKLTLPSMGLLRSHRPAGSPDSVMLWKTAMAPILLL